MTVTGDDRGPPPGGIAIPWRELPDDTLRALIESFVLREGTDYGPVEPSLDDKVGAVRQQLERGTARIVWDAVTATADIVVVHPSRPPRAPAG